MSVFGALFGRKTITPNFSEADHCLWAKAFVGHCHIYQALRFGEVDDHGMSETLAICLVVKSETDFWRYEMLCKKGLALCTDRSQITTARVRFEAFVQEYGAKAPELVKQLPGKEPYSAGQLNVLLLPPGWHNRARELEPALGLLPGTIKHIAETEHVLATKH